jgi:twitching motility protein PilT
LARIDAFLDLVVKQGGSDLHLVSGNPPRIRLNGDIYPVKYRRLSAKETEELLYEIMPQRTRTTLEARGGVDFAYLIPEVSRFRVNVFRHLDGIGAVFRTIHGKPQTLDDLDLPPVLKNLAQQRKGLILVTGPTGSGKSTTLAALLDFINGRQKGHVITIEDPIEYVHENRQCLVSQREVGTHTDSFADALRSALREDPDAIMVGEMRDLETIHLAITAAEMGILILGTLHTNSAPASVERIVNAFPAGEAQYVKTMLSTSLCGIVAQQLVRRADGRDRVAAVEVLINTPAVANIIREGSPDQLANVIQSGAMQGMQSMDNALRKLLDAKLITGNDAYKCARNKADFEQYREAEAIGSGGGFISADELPS